MGKEEEKVEEKAENDNTIIQECLEIARGEYQMELEKKTSLENRAGLILAFLGAFTAYLLEKISPRELFLLAENPPSLWNTMKFMSGLLVYVAVFFALIMLLLTIKAKSHKNFQVQILSDEFAKQDREEGLLTIKDAYRLIVVKRRELNEDKAFVFNLSLLSLLITMISMTIYLAIP